MIAGNDALINRTYNTGMRIDILTIFPEFFSGPLSQSILKRAESASAAEFNVIDIRNFADQPHRLTDDRPFGGGAGMVMKIEPIDRALKHIGARKDTSGEKIILTSAKGELYNQNTAREWSILERIVIICGHYEGVDERVTVHLVDAEVRIGDYVLTGGEPAAVVLLDSLVRLQPDVLGNQESLNDESHDTPGWLGYPQYTRPRTYEDYEVPAILLSGDHKKITEWRRSQERQDQ